jgi:MIP family channel proteins
MNDTTKKVLAELIGTFTLVLIGAGTGALVGGDGAAGLVAVALAHGLAIMTSIYVWGSISGCHINPAVTVGVLAGGRIDVVKAVLYIVAQLAGGIAAAYLLAWLIGADSGLGATVGTLTKASAAKTIVVEGVLTFFLILAVFASGVDGRNGNAAGAAIGLVVTMDILFAGPLTGASMNPARTLGPAMATGDLSYLWMYIVGPLTGGALAGLIYNQLFLPAELKPPVEAAQTETTQRR